MGTSGARIQQHTLHVFCDASERAYGAAIYARTQTGKGVKIELACSKARLAPIKRVTLPRLELLAALVGARLLRYFGRATDIDVTTATLWTDSTVTLGWIRSEPHRWKTFICNRVTEINAYTSPSQWRHCPGADNPADLLSRGLNAQDLTTADTWWHGPSWLQDSPDRWPPTVGPDNTDLPEARKSTSQAFTVSTTEPFISMARYSSYMKLVRIVRWILRFVRNCQKTTEHNDELTAAELDSSRTRLLCLAQKQSFPTEYDALAKNLPLPGFGTKM